MTTIGIFQIAFYLAVLLALVKPLGFYMARVYEGRAPGLGRVLGPIERLIYRVCGIDEAVEMGWRGYAMAMLLFNLAGMAALYLMLRIQGWLPLNPAGMGNVGPYTAFNIAASFISNTNWQNYGGEATLSYLTQMLGLTTQNFVSAASGMAVLVALIRGFQRRESRTVGNFWVDLTRTVLYILLPLSLLLAIVLVSQGVVQTFAPYQQATAIDSGAAQTIAVGPAASQIAIKQLGTNGGGFFNVNSAHPLENPTPLSNFFQMLAILLIPAALCFSFGQLVGDRRQGWAILAAMMIVFVLALGVTLWAEQSGNPRLAALGADQSAIVSSEAGLLAEQPGGNMEGKDVRFGIANSVLWATATTAASNGSVNAMHDSFTPLGGLIPMWLMQLGEVIFGGTGSGLYGMLLFAIVAIFVAGLMVGRTPEYIGKKIGPFEMKMASLGILVPPLLALVGTALAVMSESALAGRNNPGPHGLSEILYAFSSMANNNGSAFAGLGADRPLYNLVGGLAMLMARYWVALPTLAIAGSLAAKKRIPASEGTLPTHGPLFVLLLISAVLVVGALTFLPALALGPIVEHLMLLHAG